MFGFREIDFLKTTIRARSFLNLNMIFDLIIPKMINNHIQYAQFDYVPSKK